MTDPAMLQPGTLVRTRDGRLGHIAWPPANVARPGQPPRLRALVRFTEDGRAYEQFQDINQIEPEARLF